MARTPRGIVLTDESSALLKRLRAIQGNLSPRSRPVKRLRDAIEAAVIKDNTEKVLGYGSSALAGVDRYGKDLTPPAASTVKGWRLRIGRVLAPEGLLSRFITKFVVKWQWDGAQWRLVAGWVGALSRDGKHFIIYHLMGARKGSKGVDRLGRDMSQWSLPKRDVGGVTRKGWAEIHRAFREFAASVAGKGA